MIIENDLLAFIEKGGYPFMLPLLGMSLLSLAVIGERLIALRGSKIIDPQWLSRIRQSGSIIPQDQQTLLGRIVNKASGDLQNSEENLSIGEVLESRAQEELPYLRQRLWILSAIGNLAPLLGLLGTVVGLAISFSEIGASGLNQENVASGIGIALITTITGLVIAIPTLFALHGLRALGEKHFENIQSHLGEYQRWYQQNNGRSQSRETVNEAE